MDKIKDFLIVFSAILTLFSVGFGLGVLFSKILNYILSFFPESFQLPIIFGIIIALIALLTASLINLKENE
mgnify:FL=1